MIDLSPYEQSAEDGWEWRLTCPGCPVQFSGMVDGAKFYYRARHGQWFFCVSAQRDPIDMLISDEKPGEFSLGGDDELEFADWREHLDRLRKCIEQYRLRQETMNQLRVRIRECEKGGS